MAEFRCGRVAILGRPNVGKSTFLNTVLGQKVSITSAKPQTTRNRVVGILNRPEAQVILVDTPGHHESDRRINQAMIRVAEQSLEEVDLVLLVIDVVPAVQAAQKGKAILSKGEEALVDLVKRAGQPCVLGLNKVDAVEPQWLLPVIDEWRKRLDFAAVVPFSALQDDGCDRIVAELVPLLPESPAVYPEDQLMEGTEKAAVAEIIREKLFRVLEAELPYAVAVEIEQFDESERDSGGQTKIFARILVERDSQKGIVIGKGGQVLKRVGTEARKEIAEFLGGRVHLDLHVSVVKDWTENPRKLRELGLE